MKNIQFKSHKIISIVYLLFLLVQPILVYAESKCEESQYKDQNKREALKYKVAAIASILLASALGVCIPLLLKNVSALQPDRAIHFLVKAFAAGVILATGFIHILPDAFNSLTSPCLGGNSWGNFPLSGFIAMMAAIGTLMMESFATGYHRRAELRKALPVNGDEEERHGVADEGGNFHGPAAIMIERSNSSDLIRNRVISQAKFKFRAVIIMVLFFSLTTPIGISIGIAISKTYKEHSPTALIVEGALNSTSAGILIYMALVDLLAADFMNPKLQRNFRIQLGANFMLLMGACCMALLAKWGGT
ncbi:hypothetical protein RJ639_038043 [Escallonia herrerae]|uniref:Uncharacterized protein n=1 Tax=Escallonia herrerae TaxID=1293975 RepID=A0AA88WLD6_9ASTE|nr:hypothetical protein RJ639_038043 [Escallonia herrerae]